MGSQYLTHNNYFTTSGHGQDWKVHLTPCTRLPDSFYKEAIHSANLIYESASSPLILLFSGGLDSEYMVNVFKSAGIDFKVAIISYGAYNKHDTQYAFRYCESQGITPIVIDVDMDQFITSGKIIEIATTAKCCAYQIPSIMHALTKIDGTIVMANGEPYIKNFDGDWRWEETERVNSYMGWFKSQGLEGTPDFLRYTPEMTVGFLMDPRVIQLVNNEHPGKLSTRTSKHMIYSKDFALEKRSKFTGWEKLEKTPIMESEIFKEFDLLKEKYNGVYELTYNDLVDILLTT
jgi:hypothetical protein